MYVGVLWIAFSPENWKKRKARFEKAAENGAGLIHAIKDYEATNGMPPPSLDALIPSFLKSIPSTGLPDYPLFKYEVFAESKMSLAWYDLGPRNGKSMSGLWIYEDGDPDHAILALTLDQQERVSDARLDRMPENSVRTEFDIEKWKRNEMRIEMARSLPDQIDVRNKPFVDVKGILGEPSGMRILRDSPWELRIDCSNGVLNWDVFFYWPTHTYPKSIYGGGTERIGDWVYVHE